MIVGISGKIGSGKDTIGKIIQYLTIKSDNKISEAIQDTKEIDIIKFLDKWDGKQSDWQIKKFAGKLKQIVSILTGIPVEDLEKQEVKDRVLGEEWSKYSTITDIKHWLVKNRRPEFLAEQDRREGGAIFEYELLEFANSLGYNSGKITVRWLLQTVGTDAMRDVIHPNVWLNALFADYPNVDKSGKFIHSKHQDYDVYSKPLTIIGEKAIPNWIITDVRFPNELQAIKSKGGISIRVERKYKDYEVSRHSYKFANQHPSETALDGTTFDYIINNNGTIEELVEKVKEILIKEKII